MKKNWLSRTEAKGAESPESLLRALNEKVDRILQVQKRILPYAYQQIASEMQGDSRPVPVALSQLFPGIEEMTVPLGAVQESSGSTNQADMLYVVAIAKFLRAKNIFEFGTRFGQTSFHLLSASPEARVTTLDLPPDQRVEGPTVGEYYRRRGADRRITQLFGDSRAFDPGPYAQVMDFVFVDGDHTYEGVSNDTEKALQMLAPGGVIAWHDFLPKSLGVVKFAAEFSRTRPLFHIENTALLVFRDGPEAAALFAERRKNPGKAPRR